MASLPDGDLGTRLRRLREERGLTRRALAERSGINEITIARAELYGRGPRYRTLLALARGLDIDVRELVGEAA